MGNINEFLRVETGDGSGHSSGSGNCYGDGSGCGSGAGYGSGRGSGVSDVYGYGDGIGYDSGYGDGSGSAPGYGDGSGSGDCYIYVPESDVISFCGNDVFYIDAVPTIFKSVFRNYAKGYILRNDMALQKCYVAKNRGYFAHGETLKDAVLEVNRKVLINMDVDGVINEFIKEFRATDVKYPAKKFYEWHHYLTGSCEMGRNEFVRNGGYDLDKDEFTVKEFINITRNAYGKENIAKLEEELKLRNLL